MKNIVILGSSGSIGKSALWVAERFPEELNVFGLSVHRDTKTLSEQIERYRPAVVCVSGRQVAEDFVSAARRHKVELYSGESGLEMLASLPDVDVVLNAVVGFAGLRSTLAAAKSGKRVALANKESMVAGGRLVNDAVATGKSEIIPVDSEHSAIFQCLKAGRKEDVRNLILTSSGGPFRKFPLEAFPAITVEQALKHPTWNMGKKVTIDSATLMNKGLEIIEAVYLFGLPQQVIKVMIHPQSIIHSMVEFEDGSIISQLSRPDMRLPIEYALFYPERKPIAVADLDFGQRYSLDLEPPDETRFPSLRLARKAVGMGHTAPAVFNAANEVGVEAFLERRISFPEIFSLVDYALDKAQVPEASGIDSIIRADKIGRDLAHEFVTSRSA